MSELDPEVVAELRRRADEGHRPHEVAAWLWSGPAAEGSILWIAYMTRAFGIPLATLKMLRPDDDLDDALSPWIFPGTTSG